MMGLWRRIKIRRTTTIWIWSRGAKSRREHSYYITTYDALGNIVDGVIITNYNEGIRVARR